LPLINGYASVLIDLNQEIRWMNEGFKQFPKRAMQMALLKEYQSVLII